MTIKDLLEVMDPNRYATGQYIEVCDSEHGDIIASTASPIWKHIKDMTIEGLDPAGEDRVRIYLKGEIT